MLLHDLTSVDAAVHPLSRLRHVAEGLGVEDPVDGPFGAVLHATFARLPGDPAYLRNRLQPGALPLEWSFSERDPAALRFEVQPFDPELAADRRRTASIRAMREIASERGAALVTELDDLVRAAPEPKTARFDAFLGLMAHPTSPPRMKIYLELPDRVEPHGLPVAALRAQFRSIDLTPGGLATRDYFRCEAGLGADELQTLCEALDLGHRFPGLMLALIELIGGIFAIPPDGALLAIRRDLREAELKVELVGARTLEPASTMRIPRAIRPDRVAAFHRWCPLVAGESGPGPVPTVVSVKIASSHPPEVSVYVAEPAGSR